jgi:hypothetical protein
MVGFLDAQQTGARSVDGTPPAPETLAYNLTDPDIRYFVIAWSRVASNYTMVVRVLNTPVANTPVCLLATSHVRLFCEVNAASRASFLL